MDNFLWALAIFLVVNLIGGLIRVARGPDLTSRLLAAQLFSTLGVALLLILARVQDSSALGDVSLVLVLAAPVAAVAFVRRSPGRRR